MPSRANSSTLIQSSRRKSAAEKAAYHEITGAGRSRVRRPFFGLSESDERAIVDRIDRGLQDELNRT